MIQKPFLKEKRGATIVELMTIVSITAVLFSIASLSYQGYMRKASQVEAKNNLAMVFQKQHSYASSTSPYRFHQNLKTIQYKPTGALRYNIGAYWNTSTDYQSIFNGSTSTNNICKHCKGVPSHDKPCCVNPSHSEKRKDILSSTANPCFGPDESISSNSLDSINCRGGAQKQSKAGKSDQGKFYYYAVGCVSNSKRKPEELDVWIITHKKYLNNMRNAAGGETTCTY